MPRIFEARERAGRTFSVTQLTAPGGPSGAQGPPEGPPVGAPREPQAPPGRGKERGKKKRERGENGGGGREKFRGFFIRPFVTGPERCSLQSPNEKTDVDLDK